MYCPVCSIALAARRCRKHTCAKWPKTSVSAAAWAQTCAAISENDPHVRGIVVLGLDAPVEDLEASFAEAARFPLVKDPDHFLGLPIPPAGLAVASLAALAPPVGLSLFSALALSALMVSRRPFPKLSSPAGGPLKRALNKLSARENEPAEQHNR